MAGDTGTSPSLHGPDTRQILAEHLKGAFIEDCQDVPAEDSTGHHFSVQFAAMATVARFRWIRVLVAVIAAETLPILVLVAGVCVYALAGYSRQPHALTPEEFAPVAGMWIGPICGFLATLLFGLWAARRADERPIAHGAAVGIGTALLDFGLGMLGGSGEIQPVLVLSNSGRIIAGVLGGWLASRRMAPARHGDRVEQQTPQEPGSRLDGITPESTHDREPNH